MEIIFNQRILGIDFNLYKKWIEYQITLETNRSNIENDHVKPVCMFNISDDKELKHAFNSEHTNVIQRSSFSERCKI